MKVSRIILKLHLDQSLLNEQTFEKTSQFSEETKGNSTKLAENGKIMVHFLNKKSEIKGKECVITIFSDGFCLDWVK